MGNSASWWLCGFAVRPMTQRLRTFTRKLFRRKIDSWVIDRVVAGTAALGRMRLVGAPSQHRFSCHCWFEPGDFRQP